MVMLALSATLRGEAPLPGRCPRPWCSCATQEGNHRSLVLSAIEEVDPELVSMVAVMGWDHDDGALQERLLAEADLVLANAGDDVIARLSAHIASLPAGERRFQAHGPKVSLSVISRDVLELQHSDDPAGLVATRSTPRSSTSSPSWPVWTRRSRTRTAAPRRRCTSSNRADQPTTFRPYARRLTIRLRQIAKVVPRGAWPLGSLRDPFDRYKTIEGSDRWGTGLRVMSDYEDPFVVVLDERTGDESHLDPSVFTALVDQCQTRVVTAAGREHHGGRLAPSRDAAPPGPCSP